MTKREICERLMEIYCPVTDGKTEAVGTFLLNLAAPETAKRMRELLQELNAQAKEEKK